MNWAICANRSSIIQLHHQSWQPTFEKEGRHLQLSIQLMIRHRTNTVSIHDSRYTLGRFSKVAMSQLRRSEKPQIVFASCAHDFHIGGWGGHQHNGQRTERAFRAHCNLHLGCASPHSIRCACEHRHVASPHNLSMSQPVSLQHASADVLRFLNDVYQRTSAHRPCLLEPAYLLSTRLSPS